MGDAPGRRSRQGLAVTFVIEFSRLAWHSPSQKGSSGLLLRALDSPCRCLRNPVPSLGISGRALLPAHSPLQRRDDTLSTVQNLLSKVPYGRRETEAILASSPAAAKKERER